MMTETIGLHPTAEVYSAVGTTAERSLREEPIFIVGAPRSGTTLLAAILASHSRIACGQETHFFSKLGSGAVEDALTDPDWPGKAVELLISLELSEQPIHRLYGVTADQISAFLQDRPRTRRSLLESITLSYANRLRKQRWAEKTPNHLLHAHEIRASFPGAAIVRIVRDPRDVALSMRALPWASASTVANAYTWDEWDRRSFAFFKSDPRSHTVRYEDLVQDPQGSVRRLCGFLGEEFEPQMIAPEQSSRAVISPREPWKHRVGTPLDPSRAYRWKREMPDALARAVSQICSAGLRRFDYDVEFGAPKPAFIYPWTKHFAEQSEKLIVDAAAEGVRIEPVVSTRFRDLVRSEFIVASIPDGAHSRHSRLRQSLRFLALLAVRRLSGRTTPFLIESCRPHHVADRILWGAVRLSGNPWNPRDQSIAS